MDIPEFILSSDLGRIGADSRSLVRRAARGELTRIRQGVYLPAELWDQLEEWQRYRYRIHAAAQNLRTPTVFCRQSAALLWGIPVVGGATQLLHAYTQDGSGGRSRCGVQRHRIDLATVRTELREGLLVSSRLRTVLELAAFSPFVDAVAAMDHVLKPDFANQLMPLTRHELEEQIGPPFSAAAARRIRAVVDFADESSGSAGESVSRALMFLAGFQAPELQTQINDRLGLVGFADFEWRQARVVGEFDGRQKYTKAQYLGGRSPSAVVVEEKRREDRIRATGRHVVRWTWKDLQSKTRFSELLRAAGVPQYPIRASRTAEGAGNGKSLPGSR